MARDKSELDVQEHYSYGKVFLERGEPERALEEFQAALDIDRDNVDILIVTGRCLIILQKIDEAVALLEKAVALAPDFADAHYYLGRSYNESDLREKAINEFKEALNINPRYVAAKRYMNGLMKSIAGGERPRGAAPEKRDEEEDRTSKQANIHFHMGNALFQKNLLQEALVEYKEAIRLRPNYPDIRNRLGELYVRRGQFGLAQEEFLMALKINPRYVTAQLNLAECYRLHSEQLLDRAEEGYQRVLEMDPGNSRASRGLEIIRSIKNIDFV